MDVNPELFLSLPFELQEKILAYNYNLIRLFSQVDHKYRSLLEYRYITQLGNLEPSYSEIALTIVEQHSKGVLYRKDYENGNVTKIGWLLNINQLSCVSRDIKHSVMIEININNGIIGVNQIYYQLEERYNAYRENVVSRDLLLLYNIWTNRLGCMRLKPNYAKEQVLDILNKEQEKYDEFTSTHNTVDFLYKTIIINTYAFLTMNTRVFQINGHNIYLIKLEHMNNEDFSMESINQDIKSSFEAIRNKILTLS